MGGKPVQSFFYVKANALDITIRYQITNSSKLLRHAHHSNNKTENQLTLRTVTLQHVMPSAQPVQEAQQEIHSYFFHTLGYNWPCPASTVSWKQAFSSDLAAHLLINCKMSPVSMEKRKMWLTCDSVQLCSSIVNIFHKLQMVSELGDICRNHTLVLSNTAQNYLSKE